MTGASWHRTPTCRATVDGDGDGAAVVVDGGGSGVTASSVDLLTSAATGNGGTVVINASSGLSVLAGGQVAAAADTQG